VHEAPRSPVAPRAAAAVILVRDGPAGLEVLLLQRHPASRFSPGAFAFPGGRLEPSDAAPGIERHCRGLERAAAARRLPDVAPAERAIGFWVAALREAFEEVGLLLAYDASSRPVDPGLLALARERRPACRADSGVFVQLLEALRLTLATERLAYWAHWITPEERPVRYDTRFFVAAALPDQTPEPDGLETVGWRWLAPADALGRHEAGELTLPFPTQRILASLAPPPDVEALLRTARDVTVRPVRPRVVREAGRDRILLPDDPGWF
jgi:8-oxo-dGTP pyrophosphatase MutT (NUDIX family)